MNTQKGAVMADVSVEAKQFLYRAAINCGHSIEAEEITLHRNPKLPGNALSQLADRLDAAQAEITAALSANNQERAAGTVGVSSYDINVLRELSATLIDRSPERHNALERLLAATQPPSASPVAVPEMYLADGVTSNPAWLTFKHCSLNPAIEAALPDAGLDSQKGAS